MSAVVLRDVVYARIPGFRPLTLDLHQTGAALSPVVFFVHGGGWRVGSRGVFGPNFTSAESFERLVAAGFAVVSIDYRLSGEAHFPAQLDDARAALAWLHENADEHGLDPSRVIVWGESAGATIGSLLALEPASGVAGVIDWYGPANLVAMAERLDRAEVASSRESEWLGGTAFDLPEAARAASPEFQVHAGAPPFFIAHGTADRFVPITQSERFADALAAARVPVEFTAEPGADHLWNGAADPTRLFDEALAFARRIAASQVQRRLWGADPQGWALYSEPHNLPLFEALLDAAGVGDGSELLDIACGTGLLLQLADARGARVTGIDVTPGLLAVAAERLPDADLRVLDMQRLPFADGSFDAVTAVNAFPFADDPVAAIAEAARVVRSGGRIAVGMFAEPERSQSTAIHEAMTALSPPERAGEHAPYALSAPGNLEAAFAAAGLAIDAGGEVECVWAYDEVAHAVRGLRGSGGGTRAVEDVGWDAVGTAIEGALAPFTDPATGKVAMVNTFRWVSAVKP